MAASGRQPRRVERYRILVLLVAAALLVAGSILYTGHVQGQIECLTEYSTANQERAKVLTQIAAEDRAQSIAAEQNITRLITDAIAAQGDRAAGRRAATRYLKTSEQIAQRRAELERARAAHPFPAAPERTCT